MARGMIQTTWVNMVCGNRTEDPVPGCLFCGCLLKNRARKGMALDKIEAELERFKELGIEHFIVSTTRNIVASRRKFSHEALLCTCCHHFAESRMHKGHNVLPMLALYMQLNLLVYGDNMHLDTRIVHKLAQQLSEDLSENGNDVNDADDVNNVDDVNDVNNDNDGDRENMRNFYTTMLPERHVELLREIAAHSMQQTTHLTARFFVEQNDNPLFVHNARVAELLREMQAPNLCV